MKTPHPTTLCERILNRIFSHKIIQNCDGDPYLLRWYVFKTARVSLFLHKFIRSDEDRALHDHPWAFLVIPVWRGYVEHSHSCMVNPKGNCPATCSLFRPERQRHLRVYPLLSTRYRPATYCHRVELIEGKPAWSVFFHFTNEREWGFHPAEGFINWKAWAKNHQCE